MKFLDPKYDKMDIMLLNIYYDRGSWSNSDDVLYILFKELDTEKKRIVEIIAPDIEVHIVKPEYREHPELIGYDPDILHDWIDKAYCDTYRVNYKNRWKEIGQIIGCKPDQVKVSPWVFGADMDLDIWYIHQFLKEYPTNRPGDISVGFYDIETDTVNFDGWPETGEAPISVITYIDGPSRTSYTLIYHNCGIKPNHPRYEELSKKYDDGYDYFINHLDEFDKELHSDFDASYGHLDYVILTFESEIEMLQVFFKLVNESANDFNEAWNAPFDFGELITRPSVLGYDPLEIIADKSFNYPCIAFKEDTAFNVVKRKHLMFSPTLTVWTDSMVNYAAIRSQKGKLPSNKLNYVAKVELNDEKLDYSEETDIKHFMYDNFWKFVKYNIKDVLLMFGLENKNRDLLDVLSRISMLALPPYKVFASLPMEDSAFIRYMDNYRRNGEGYWPGPNRSKLGANEWIASDGEVEPVIPDDDDNDSFDGLEEYGDIFADNDEDDGVDYEGAIVLHPGHMTPSGHKINGDDKKFIHDNLIDMDITAEYPTACILQNASNETLHGKIFFVDQLKDIPIYPNFEFADKQEAEDYTVSAETFIMEAYQQDQIGIIGEMVLNLPGISTMVETIEKEGIDIYE